MIFISYKYVMNPYLWFDEAGQFWISKGLNHDSDPMSAVGGMFDVVKNNQDYNLDPGGFGLILHFWSKISNNYIWLRSLPFLFLMLIVASFICLAHRWTGDRNISILAGFIPLLIPLIFRQSFDIRAYSMEALGVVVAIVALDSLSAKVTMKKLIGWSVAIAFFMTSRYSYIIVAFVVSTYVLWLIYKTDRSPKQKIVMLLLYAAPLVVVLIYDYLFAMQYQNPSLNQLTYLRYISNGIVVFLYNHSMLIVSFCVCLILWLYIILRKSELVKKYCGLVYVAVVTYIIFFVLSCLGIYPWNARACVSLVMLAAIAMMALWCELSKMIINYSGTKVIAFLFICVQLCGCYNVHIQRPERRSDAYTDFLSIDYRGGKVYVDRWESPFFRYLFEYGDLKGNENFYYPNNFHFEKFIKHRVPNGNGINDSFISDWYKSTQRDLNELTEYDILVVPELYGNRPENCDKWMSVKGRNCVWIKK